MKPVPAYCMALLILASGCATTGLAAQGAVIGAKNKVAPAMVHIRPVKEVFTEGKRKEILVVGSGFIISRDGYVVTNEHVAGESKLVRCVLYNKEDIEAEVVGVDRDTDIAVLKLKTERQDLPTVKLGVSKKLQAGQSVLALGSPHGLARSVSLGIVSVPDRYLGGDWESASPYSTWIQTDAAINEGNSGGPMVNLKGEVVGINSRKLMGAENVGFAIPIDIAREAIEQIIQHGRVQRGWIGITLQEMTRKTDDPHQKGVVIADVDPLSPAYEAKLLPGDVLLAINEQPTNARFVEDLPAVNKLIADLPVNQEVVVRVARGDAELDVMVPVVEKTEARGREVEFAEWGFTASEVTPTIARRAQLSSKKGIWISGVQVGGPASQARLQEGEILLKVDDKEVTDLATFQEIYKDLVTSGKRLVLLDMKRGALSRFILIKQNGQGELTADTLSSEGAQGDAE